MGAAFEQFKSSIELASSLKKLEREKYNPNPRVNERPFVKGLRGGASVLMVAAFEFFLNKLFEEEVGKLNTVPVSIDFNKLPNQLQIKAVFDGLKGAMEGPRFKEKLPKKDRIKDIIDVCKLLINEQVSPSTFSDTNSNPNGATVNQKFKEVGINDIFDKIKSSFERKWKSPVAHTFIKDKLDEIVRTRNVVAHTTDTLSITRQKQNEAIRFLKILAELLEKELVKQINTIKKNAKR